MEGKEKQRSSRHSQNTFFFPLLRRYLCLLKKIRKFPACSFLMVGCLSLPELTEKDFVKVNYYLVLNDRLIKQELWVWERGQRQKSLTILTIS